MSHRGYRDRFSPNKTERGLGSQVDYCLQGHIPESKLAKGDVSKRIAIRLSDGRTIVYAIKGKNISKVKDFWERIIHRIE